MLSSFEHFMVLRLFEDYGFHDDELLLLDFNIAWYVGHFVHPFPYIADTVSGLDNVQDSHGDGVFVFVRNSVQDNFPQGILFLFFLHLVDGLDIENEDVIDFGRLQWFGLELLNNKFLRHDLELKLVFATWLDVCESVPIFGNRYWKFNLLMLDDWL